MMYSAYKLNKQGDNIQPWRTPFTIGNQSIVTCTFLTVAYRFHRRQIRRFGIPISWRIFHSLLWSTQSIWHSQWNRIRFFFLELSCFFCNPTDVGNLISGYSAFSISSLKIWKFMVHVLLKPGLGNFEHYFASMWNVLWANFSLIIQYMLHIRSPECVQFIIEGLYLLTNIFSLPHPKSPRSWKQPVWVQLL